MAKDMFLYWGSGSPPCWRVMLVLEEKGLGGYPNKLVAFSKKEHKGEDVLKLNPRGQVPTFQHGDIVINESLAAIDYLESVFSNQGTKLVPDDPQQKALVLQRKFEALNIQKKASENLVMYLRSTKPEDQNQELLQERKQAVLDELMMWEGFLSKLGSGAYIAGKDFSMADVVFYPQLALLVRIGLKLAPRWPGLSAYYDRVTARPSVQATWPPHWNDSPAGDMLASL